MASLGAKTYEKMNKLSFKQVHRKQPWACLISVWVIKIIEVQDHKWAPYSKILIYFSFDTLPHKWLEIYNNKSTALPFENHLQLQIMINKTCSLEITIDVSAISLVVIFQPNFGYAYLQCIKYFLLTNKFISVFSLKKSSFERAEQWVYLSLGAKTYEKMNKLSYKQVHRKQPWACLVSVRVK